MSRTHVRDASLVFTIPINGVMTQLSVPGRIYSTVKSDNGKSLRQICPDCNEPIRMDVNCANNHGPIDRATLLKGKIVDGAVVIVDDVAEVVESDIAKGKLTLKAVTRESLVAGTIPHGASYHYMPIPGDSADKEAYTILYSAITDNPDWAFVCRANIGRGAETLVSVEAGAYGGLTLQTLAYPEQLYDLPEFEVDKLTKSHKTAVRSLVEDLVEEFNPDEWLDRQAVAIADAVKAASAAPNRKGGVPKAKKVKETTPGLLSAIAAAAKAS